MKRQPTGSDGERRRHGDFVYEVDERPVIAMPTAKCPMPNIEFLEMFEFGIRHRYAASFGGVLLIADCDLLRVDFGLSRLVVACARHRAGVDETIEALDGALGQ